MHSKNSSIIWTLTVLSVAVIALLLVGCDSKSTLDDAPANTQINVTASPTTITTGSTAVVDVAVLSGGSGVVSQEITFTVSPSDAGYFTPTSAMTDAEGNAGSIFTANTSGFATISATLAGTTLSSAVGVTLNAADPGDQGNVSITVTPGQLMANGVDTARVTVAVRHPGGEPAADGTVVRLTAGEQFTDNDEDGYFTEGVDWLDSDANGNSQWDAIGILPSTAVTAGGSGLVNVDYISGQESGPVYIKATVNSDGLEGSAEAQVLLAPNREIYSIFLASDSINLVVKHTGGIETANLFATGYDIFGNALPEDIPITFVITDGPGGGENLGTVGADTATVVTNGSGVAQVPVHSGTASGTIRIRAYSDTVLSNATQVMISAGPPAHIVVAAANCNVPYWDNVAEEVGVVAVISDVYLNPVPDSTIAYFSTDEGTMKSHEARSQDLEGVVHTKWIAGTNVPTADGIVEIYVETSGGTVADTSFFYNTHYPDDLYVFGAPASMVADGSSKVTVVVAADDLNDNPVVGGTKFEAEANFLSVTGGTFEDGCTSASDRVVITSTTLPVDYSRSGVTDDGIGAVDNVLYYTGATAATTVSITLTTGTAYTGSSAITGPAKADPGATISLSAVIKDRWGNPLADHTLNMTATSGVVTGGSQETNEYGEAAGFNWTAPATGSAQIIITDTDPRGGIVLTSDVTVNE